jgi:hypothetical protein
MIEIFESLAFLGFALWGIYKGVWVLRRLLRPVWIRFRAWRVEQAFIDSLAAAKKFYGETR